MTSIGLLEAKTQLSALVERAAKGEEILITKHGKPLAKLIGAAQRDTEAVKAAVAKFREQRKDITLGGLSIRALRDEGRM